MSLTTSKYSGSLEKTLIKKKNYIPTQMFPSVETIGNTKKRSIDT